MRKQIPYALMDLLVIAACCMVFGAMIGAGKSRACAGRSQILGRGYSRTEPSGSVKIPNAVATSFL